MNSDWDTRKPIEPFFPTLATLDAVQVPLRKTFRKSTLAIINKLKAGQPLVDNHSGIWSIGSPSRT
jgi:hypothetical protein